MADFEAQVNAITNLGIDGSATDPGRTELSQFLNDGIVDVTNKIAKLRPQDREQFTRVSGEVTSNGSEKVARASILSVVRESGTNNDWRPCNKISPVHQSVVTDPESLFFASKYHPSYMVAEDGAISVFPAPGSDPDAFKVYYINNNPRGDDDNSVTYATSGLAFFPKDKEYLIIIYASIKSLEASLSAVNISTFSLTAVPPDVPTLSESSVTITGTAPTYTAPSLDASSDQITEMEAGAIGSAQTDTEQWFDVAGDFIETEEDSELAAAQLQKISAYLQAYSASMQNQLHKFNDANVEYQATLQKNIKDADFDNQEEARLLQKYGAEVQEYQAEVAAEVQTYQQEVAEKSTEYQWQTARLQDLKQEYAQAFAIMAPPPQAQQPQRRARR